MATELTGRLGCRLGTSQGSHKNETRRVGQEQLVDFCAAMPEPQDLPPHGSQAHWGPQRSGHVATLNTPLGCAACPVLRWLWATQQQQLVITPSSSHTCYSCLEDNWSTLTRDTLGTAGRPPHPEWFKGATLLSLGRHASLQAFHCLFTASVASWTLY